MQMQAAMGRGGGGMGGMGGMGGLGGGFNPFATPGQNAGEGGTAPPTDPFPNLFAPQATQQQPSTGAGATGAGVGGQGGAGNPAANPFASLFGMPGGGAGAGAGAGGGNPFGGFDPSMLFGGGGFGGAGAGGSSPWAPPPRDTRPPEEIYATQLGQLNAMVSCVV